MSDKKINAARMRYLESKSREVGKLIDFAINERTGRKYGFALLLFSFNGAELTYISNAQRADMIQALEEVLGRWKRGDVSDFPGGVDAGN